jgi:single-strand DNA-binding protein
MASLNKVLLIGNFTRDPELRYLPSNTAVVSFSLAVNEKYKDKDGNLVERADFIDCEAFAKTAENIGKFFAKGRPIFIEGRLRLDQWEDKASGQKRSKLKVIAENFQFIGPPPGQGGPGGAPASGAYPAERSGERSGPAPARAPRQSAPSHDDGHGEPGYPSDEIPF